MNQMSPSKYVFTTLVLSLLMISCTTVKHVSRDHRTEARWSRTEGGIRSKLIQSPKNTPQRPQAAPISLPKQVSDTLDRAGVKLAVVEFYATWCKPCMEAVPRWKALHENYRERGLRLIVVNTQDPNGGCAAPGWMPDELVCDLDGRIAERMNVQSLPSAFLYSWQGNTLVQQAHIDTVEAEIEAYMLRNPRVQIDASGDSALAQLVRNEVARQGKFTVVATNEERAEAAEIRREGFKSNYSAKGRCKLGQEVSANSWLKASVVQSLLSLQLFSAESSCLLQGVSVRYRDGDAEGSVAEAVDKLIDALKTDA